MSIPINGFALTRPFYKSHSVRANSARSKEPFSISSIPATTGPLPCLTAIWLKSNGCVSVACGDLQDLGSTDLDRFAWYLTRIENFPSVSTISAARKGFGIPSRATSFSLRRHVTVEPSSTEKIRAFLISACSVCLSRSSCLGLLLYRRQNHSHFHRSWMSV